MSLKSQRDEFDAKGRSRAGSIATFLRWRNGFVVFVLFSPLLVRAWCLSKVPDIPTPFDVTEFCSVEIPPGQNAFDDYIEAYRLKEKVDAVRNADNNESLWANFDEVVANGWSAAKDPLKKWLEDYRETLVKWRRGTECSDAQYLSRSEMDFSSEIPVSHSLREIARIAQIEAARLEAVGDFDEAGQIWIAILRSSRHAGRSGVAVERLTGRVLHHWATEGLNRWAANPEVTIDQLKSVLRQVQDADRMSVPLSSLFKSEYLTATNTLKRRDWMQMTMLMNQFCGNRFEYFDPAYSAFYWIAGEPLVTQRLLKHILANQLNEVDKPLPDRRSLAGTGTAILFEPDPSVPLQPNQLNPTRIDRALERSKVEKGWFLLLKSIVDSIDRERAQQVTIEVALALHVYQREHGEFPEELSAIVPSFFDHWPVDPCDSTGKRLSYRRDDSKSAVVWSVGPDGQDNDGDVIDTKSGKSVDVGFVLKSQ